MKAPVAQQAATVLLLHDRPVLVGDDILLPWGDRYPGRFRAPGSETR